MISSVWQWFIIGLVITGASAGVIGFVIFLYLFAIWAWVDGTLTDKFAFLGTLRRKLARNSFDGLSL